MADQFHVGRNTGGGRLPRHPLEPPHNVAASGRRPRHGISPSRIVETNILPAGWRGIRHACMVLNFIVCAVGFNLLLKSAGASGFIPRGRDQLRVIISRSVVVHGHAVASDNGNHEILVVQRNWPHIPERQLGEVYARPSYVRIRAVGAQNGIITPIPVDHRQGGGHVGPKSRCIRPDVQLEGR